MPRYEVLYGIIENTSAFLDFDTEPSDGDVLSQIEAMHPFDEVQVQDWYESDEED
jgi:hypothetical protein